MKIFAVILFLVVTVGVSGASTSYIYADGDTYATPYHPTWNYGGSDLIISTGTPGMEVESYLKFPAGVFNVNTSAVFHFYISSIDVGTTNPYKIYFCELSTSDWGEYGLTWNNQPTCGSPFANVSIVPGSWTGWQEVDISGFVKSKTGAFSFKMNGSVSTYTDLNINSRHMANQPYITIQNAGDTLSYVGSSPYVGNLYYVVGSINNFTGNLDYWVDLYRPIQNTQNTEKFTTFSPVGSPFGTPYYVYDFRGYYEAKLYSKPWWDLVYLFKQELTTKKVFVGNAVMTGNYTLTTDQANYYPGGTVVYWAENPSDVPLYLAVRYGGDIYDIVFTPIQVPAHAGKSIVTPITSNYYLGRYEADLVSDSSGFGNILATAYWNLTAPGNTSNVLGLIWSGDAEVGKYGELIAVSNYNSSRVDVYEYLGISNSLYKTFNLASNTTVSNLVYFRSEGSYNAKIVDLSNFLKYLWANTTVYKNDTNEDPVTCREKETFVCFNKLNYSAGEPYKVDFRYAVPTIPYYDFRMIIYDPEGRRIINQLVGNVSENSIVIGSYSGVWSKVAIGGYYSVVIEKFYGTVSLGGKETHIAYVSKGDSGNQTGDGGFDSDELANRNDLMYNYKVMLHAYVGTSESTLFLIGIIHVILFAAAFLWLVKVPIAGLMGALLGLAFSIQLTFIPFVWGVILVVLCGVTVMTMLKKA